MIIRRPPKDPLLFAERGDKAFKEGNYHDAELAYHEAILATKEPKEYFYKMALMQWEWAKLPDLTRTEAAEHYSYTIQFLRKAMLRDPSYVDAQQFLADIDDLFLG